MNTPPDRGPTRTVARTGKHAEFAYARQGSFTMQSPCLGIDVSKDKLDLASTDRFVETVPNNPAACRQLARRLAKQAPAMVAVEATGAYERKIVQALLEAEINVAVVQPSCVRYYAKSMNLRAKNDRLDAQVIARYAQTHQPRPSCKPDPDQQRLRALHDRREQIIEDRVREQNRLESGADSEIRRQLKQSIKRLERMETQLEKKIADCIASSERFAKISQALSKACGAGPVLIASLIAHMPELGLVNRQQIAALAGVAPYDCESGRFKGQRRIFGGRAPVRKALFMAALSAPRWNPQLKALNERLKTSGKRDKVARIAVARKLLVYLNSLAAEYYRENPKHVPTGILAA